MCLCLPVKKPSLGLCSYNNTCYSKNECEYSCTLTRCVLGPLEENQHANGMHTFGMTFIKDMKPDLNTHMHTEGGHTVRLAYLRNILGDYLDILFVDR